jgi:hypothetical protein
MLSFFSHTSQVVVTQWALPSAGNSTFAIVSFRLYFKIPFHHISRLENDVELELPPGSSVEYVVFML